jgi:hypothetical protein
LIAFLTFDARSIATDAGSVWANGGGSTTDFDLDEHLKVALQAAQRHRKQVWLSIGGESGSGGFLPWWQGLGASSAERTERMRAELERVSARFEAQNGVHVDGFDVDVELGGFYGRTSDKYVATRDLINAVPAPRRVAFTPQVSNGLCAAPAPGDALPAALTLGGGCDGPSGEDPRWVLASLDDDCKTAEGGPKLEYFGVQYYNEGTDPCCGGGPDPSAIVRSTLQHYVNLANGWPAPTESDHSSGRTWAAFAGIGADRLVIGKPGCAGCAESGYLDLPNMMKLIDGLDHRLRAPMGGVLFWELCRMFGRAGDLCEANGCQPSWGGKDILTNLAELRRRMSALRVLVPN